MAGWIHIARKIAQSDLWTAETFSRGQAWVDLLLLANWKDGHVRIRGVRIDLARGQLAASSVFLAERWQWSRGKVIRFLNELENDHRIEQQKRNITTVVTIVNYDEYQKTDIKRTPNRTTDGQQTGQQTDTQEEETKKKKEEERAQGPSVGSKDSSRKRFVAPTVEEVRSYCEQRKNSVDAAQFVDHYTSNGWKIGGRAAMKDWKAAVRTWERNRVNGAGQSQGSLLSVDEQRRTYAP